MDLGIRLTRHACKVAARKGFTPEQILDAFANGEREPNDDVPGQFRITGDGLVLVGAPDHDKFVVITCYGEKS